MWKTRIIGIFVICSALYQIGFVPVSAQQQYSSRISRAQLVQQVAFENTDLSQEFYLTQSKPAAQRVDEQRRLEAERKAKEEAERKAQEAEQARLQQLLAARASKPIISSSQINGDFESAIRNRCAAVGCNPEQVIRIMYCESGGRSNAYNSSGASGLFQFMPRTFQANASRIGITNPDIWNPWQQIDTATYMFANGQAWQWSCK